MVASTITDPETCESFFASKSFDVYDLVFGKFLSWKKTLYYLYHSIHRCRRIDVLQWTWELLFLHGVR